MRNLKRIISQNKGFTLIELLVVISIIAVLMSIMMPSLQRARANARKLVCATNLSQMGIGMQMYFIDNDNEIPPIRRDLVAGTVGQDSLLWMHHIAPYMGNRKGGLTLNQGGYWTEDDAEIERVLAVFKCPSQKDPFYWNWYIRYGMNMLHASTGAKKIIATRVSNPSSRMLIADSMDEQLSFIEPDPSRDRLRADGVMGFFGNQIWPFENIGSPEVYLVSDRHQAGSNMLFMDGSTSWAKYEDIMYKRGEDKSERVRKVRMWDYTQRKSHIDAP